MSRVRVSGGGGAGSGCAVELMAALRRLRTWDLLSGLYPPDDGAGNPRWEGEGEAANRGETATSMWRSWRSRSAFERSRGELPCVFSAFGESPCGAGVFAGSAARTR